ncbi:hypothetical protein D9758_004673 [Tetrapyrgos nigripes]|uniref:Inositol polyphosphate-related phosphatase domain-containing protein n=1 Tax=Tetrapyrgos nigripes TaxID=182062 RepID=A0A8H5H0G4_9AGAR|nr:hypothetical protein D9758_004673 [Tetrapyrgos nigripes]
MDQNDIESTHIDAVKNLRSRFEQLAHHDSSPPSASPIASHRLSTMSTLSTLSTMSALSSTSSLQVPSPTTPTRVRTLSKGSDDNPPSSATNSRHLRTASSSSDIKVSARRPPPPPPPHAQSSSRSPSPSPSQTSPRGSPLLRPVSSTSSLRQFSSRPSIVPLVTANNDSDETIDPETPTPSVAALRNKFLITSPSLSSPALMPTIGKLNMNGFHSHSDTTLQTYSHQSPPTVNKPPPPVPSRPIKPAVMPAEGAPPLIPELVSSPEEVHSHTQSFHSSSFSSIDPSDPFGDSSSGSEESSGFSNFKPPALPARRGTNTSSHRPSLSSSSSRTSSESDGVSSNPTYILSPASKFPIPPPRPPPRHSEASILSPVTPTGPALPSRPPLPARRNTSTHSDELIGAPPKLPQRQGTTVAGVPPPPPLATHPSLAGQHSQFPATPATSVGMGAATIYPTDSSASASTSALLGERKALGASKLLPPPTRTIALGDKLPPARKDEPADDSDMDSGEDDDEGASTSKTSIVMDPDTTRVSRRPPFLLARTGGLSGNFESYGCIGRPEWSPRIVAPGECVFTNNWIVVALEGGHGSGVAIYDIGYSLDRPRFLVSTKQVGVKDGKVTAMEVRGSGVTLSSPSLTSPTDAKGKGKQLERGCFVWIGTKDGHLVEIDCRTGDITGVKHSAHIHPIVHIFRHGASMVSVDDSGKVLIFSPPPDSSTEAIETGEVRLLLTTPRVMRITDKLDFCILLGGCLWTGARSEQHTHGTGPAGKTPIIRVYDVFTPGSIGKSVMPYQHVGAATCAAILPTRPGYVYVGHEEGYITIWDVGGGPLSKSEFSEDNKTGSYAQPHCVELLKLQVNDVLALQGVNNRLWVGNRAGYITVYDVGVNPWFATNSWPAHMGLPVGKIMVDPWGIERLGRLGVVTVGRDNKIGLWDGLLAADWLDNKLVYAEAEYSRLRDLKVLMVSWNCDASKPDALLSAGGEANLNFLSDVLRSVDSPDIITFGFQEIIDLESRKLAAKTVVYGRNNETSSKKKDGPYVKGSLWEYKDTDEAAGSNSNSLGLWDKVSSVYRKWYDQLVLAVRLAMPPDQPYSVVYTQSMVGLFSCIFVKQAERSSVRNLGVTSIKRGMGGRYGNKGAIVLRFVFQDTSICFLNCHLAAGQSATRSRNNDIAGILESQQVFNPAHEPLAFLGGGDGSMIMDHEIVFINGDLNYRIDLPRKNIIASVRAGDLDSLLPHDQLRKNMRDNRGCRFRAFTEGPLKFAPTYKYDRRSNEYDSSEKSRAPAWCDRILWRSKVPERVQQLFYKRHEVNVSDHRPISSAFTIQVKTVKEDARQKVKAEIQMKWIETQRNLLAAARDFYVSHMMM